MQVILTAKSDFPPRRTLLRQGQIVQVGRTAWADVSFPHDAEMADVHFSLECGQHTCLLRSLQQGSPTLLNGDPATESEVNNGDEITAGRTVFAVTIEGKPLAPQAGPAARDAPAEVEQETGESGFPHVAFLLSREVASNCELGDEAAALLADEQNPREFLDKLIEAGLSQDAIGFLAAALPPREAVWWACLCIGGETDAADAAALEAAKTWVADPTEDNRRAAQTAAKATQIKTAAGCAAHAAFMSGGSINDPGMPEVLPPPQLAGRLIGSAVRLTVLQGDPKEMDAGYRHCLELGLAVADGEQRWE